LRAMYQLGDGPLFAGAVVAEHLAAHSAKCKIYVVCGLMRAVFGLRFVASEPAVVLANKQGEFKPAICAVCHFLIRNPRRTLGANLFLINA